MEIRQASDHSLPGSPSFTNLLIQNDQVVGHAHTPADNVDIGVCHLFFHRHLRSEPKAHRLNNPPPGLFDQPRGTSEWLPQRPGRVGWCLSVLAQKFAIKSLFGFLQCLICAQTLLEPTWKKKEHWSWGTK